MHPAPSVILFTTFSGLGFGLLFFLGLGFPDVTGWVAFVFFLIAYVFAVGGLAASTFHLGNPQRAFKAFSQWRSSWLSREGICAVAALVFMGLYGFGLVFLDTPIWLFGLLGSLLSLTTVYTTSMIYTQLRTVPRWHQRGTPVLFLTMSLAGGALLAGQLTAAIILLIGVGFVQVVVWLRGDTQLASSGTTLETATGLGGLGKVRLFEPPHTGTNYLLKEMVYVVGRKHADKLRILSLLGMVVLPVLLLLLTNGGHVAAFVAVLCHIAGVLVARWLFFAQAEHVVGLYYGKR